MSGQAGGGGLYCQCNRSVRNNHQQRQNSKKASRETKIASPPMSSEHSILSDSRLLPSRFQATSSGNRSKRFSVHNEDLGNVAEETVINMRVCPFCLLEINKKPMTPSNYVQANNSFMSNPERPMEHNTMSPMITIGPENLQ